MEFDAIREQLQQLHESAFGWAMICCGRDHDLAADVLQHAYCRILAGDAEFSGRSEFSTWVFGVIRHVAHEEIRNAQRHRRNIQTSGHEAQTDSLVFDRCPIEQRELSEQLWTAMQQLSTRQREVLHLKFYQDMTVEQAANVLEISIGSARQHYQRGKESLRRILAKNREFER